MIDQRRYGGITYSQTGADLLILNLCELLGIAHPSYLDIGAHHPTDISNTALLYARGSRGFNVEANPDLMNQFYIDRKEDTNICIGITPTGGLRAFYRVDRLSGRNSFSKYDVYKFVAGSPGFRLSDVLDLETITLNACVDTYCAGVFPDILLLDIEGLDLAVLETTDFSKSQPKIICAETVDFKFSMFRNVLGDKGFVPYCRLIADAIFIRRADAIRLERS